MTPVANEVPEATKDQEEEVSPFNHDAEETLSPESPESLKTTEDIRETSSLKTESPAAPSPQEPPLAPGLRESLQETFHVQYLPPSKS